MGKTFENHISDNVLMSKLHKKTSHISITNKNKKTSNLIKKQQMSYIDISVENVYERPTGT